MNISKYMMAAASLVLALSSCSDDGYWDEYSDKEVTYSFEQPTLNVATVKDANTFTVNVVRSTKKGTTTLPITLSNVTDVTFDDGEASNNITLSTNSLTFEDGQNEASVDVTINCLGGHEYVGVISFPAEQVSVSGSAVCKMSFATEHNWVSLGTGIFIDQWALSSSTETPEYPVEILQAEGFQRWRVLNPYTQGMTEDIGEWEDWRTGVYPAYLEFWESGENLTWTPIAIGLNYQGVSGQAIYAYPPSALDATMKNCRWYMPGYACLSPYYYIPGVGGWNLSGNFGVIQIIFPDLL